jgi:hypothetical protein
MNINLSLFIKILLLIMSIKINLFFKPIKRTPFFLHLFTFQTPIFIYIALKKKMYF